MVEYNVSGSEILNELASMGAGNAATALSAMIQKKISIDVPSINIVSPVKVPDILQLYDLQTVVVIEQLTENKGCNLLLVFPLNEARRLGGILAEEYNLDEDSDEFTFMEELGNIMMGHFLNAISDFTGIRLQPVPPTHVVDFFDSILDVFLARISMEERSAILFNTQLRCDEEKVNCTIIMFVGRELQEKMIRIGEEWLT
jgi:chemotaxis protein CheC